MKPAQVGSVSVRSKAREVCAAAGAVVGLALATVLGAATALGATSTIPAPRTALAFVAAPAIPAPQIALAFMAAPAIPTSQVAQNQAPIGSRVELARRAQQARLASPPSAGKWPDGTKLLRFENVEGILLVSATLRGEAERETTGVLALDTGAGYLALDRGLARILGVADSLAPEQTILLADRALSRLVLGDLELDRVSPILTVDGRIIQHVTDRPVLGLLGQRPLGGWAVSIDFDSSEIALIPVPAQTAAPANGALNSGEASLLSPVARSRVALESVLLAGARAVPFELLGDGKIVVKAHASNPRPPAWSEALNLIVDTGATKCVLFEDSLVSLASGSKSWRALRGLKVPTLIGNSDAHIAMIPSLRLDADTGAVYQADVDAAVLRSDLSAALTNVTGLQIHGLLGSSFLQHYRVVIDYPNRVLWLSDRPGRVTNRRYEYTHIGLQLERRERSLRVVAVAEGSPAELAGIREGDDIVAVNGRRVDAGAPADSGLDVVRVSRLLEGPAGTRIRVTMRRDGSEKTYRLIRRRLL